MPVTIEQVMAYLNADEPRYAEAARLGEDAVPYLMSIVAEADSGLASKATYLAALIPSSRSGEVVRTALSHRAPVVRVAAAAALPFLPLETATPLLLQSLRDADPGVRRLALDALPQRASPALYDAVEQLVRDDAEPGLRLRSNQILTRWREADLSPRKPGPGRD
jgi:HEAT repeat protein